MYKKAVLRIVYFYQFTMSALVTIVFLLIPLTQVKLSYSFVGWGLFIWLFFILIYVSIVASVKKMLDNKYPFYSDYYMDLRRDTSSFMIFLLTSIFTVILMYALMRWTFTLYLPDISTSFISIVSALNGLILGALNFSLFFYLPRE